MNCTIGLACGCYAIFEIDPPTSEALKYATVAELNAREITRIRNEESGHNCASFMKSHQEKLNE